MMLRNYGWFKLAATLGISLRQCQREHTHREYLQWLAYFEFESDNPSRADYYAMQIAATIAAANSKEGADIKINDFKLKREKPVVKPEMTQEEYEAGAKRFSQGFIGAFKALYGKGKKKLKSIKVSKYGNGSGTGTDDHSPNR